MKRLGAMAAEWRAYFAPSQLLPALSAGLVIGILMVFIEISFAAVIFSGPLKPYVAQGIGMMLFGLTFFALSGALFGFFPTTTTAPQDGPVAVLSMIGAALAAQTTIADDPDALFYSVVAAIAVATALTGLFFFLVGRFQLGNLGRFIPFPVVGGFLAGAGWLLVQGAVGVMVDVPFGLDLFDTAILARWVPGALFAVAFLLILRVYTPYWLMPGFLTGGVVLFYIVYALINGEIASAEAGGWLLGPFPSGSLWRPFLLPAVSQARFDLVLTQLPNVGTILLLSLVAMLLNISALSVSVNQDIDMNRELRTLGLTNLLGSLFVVTPGYGAMSLSVLGHRLAGNNRLVNVFVALLAGIGVLLGASFLNFFPRIIAGGFLLHLGLSVLMNWLWTGRHRVSRAEYVMMLIIVLVVVFAGFLEGVVVGLIIATILFATNYSRTRFVRLATNAEAYRSQVQRPLLHQQLLKQQGHKLQLLALQGYLFFGVADRLVDLIKAETTARQPDFLLLDFRLVTGIDSSAMLTLNKLMQLAQASEFVVVWTALAPRLAAQVRREVLSAIPAAKWRMFAQMDEGLAWCEEQLLAHFTAVGLVPPLKSLQRQWAELIPAGDTDFMDALLQAAKRPRQGVDPRQARLAPYLEQRSLAVGEILIDASTPFDGLILIETGQVLAQVLDAEGDVLAVDVVAGGTIIGELGHYHRRIIHMAVMATAETTAFLLPAAKIAALERDDPAAALALHRLVISLISGRSVYLADMLQAHQL